MAERKPLGVRVLEQRRIDHEVVRFPDDVRSAAGVAEAAGLGLNEVFKTLVIQTGRASEKPFLVLVPADREVDLKLLAAQVGAKRLQMATHRDAERLTGLKVGGISSLALLQKAWRVLIDDSAAQLSTVLVSAGARGWDVRLAVSDLISLTGAQLVRVAEQGGAAPPEPTET